MLQESGFTMSVLTLAAALTLTGCRRPPSFDTAYTRITPTTVQPGDLIPPASTVPIITVTGNIQASQLSPETEVEGNAENKTEDKSETAQPQQKTITMDEAGLRSVGLVEYTVRDPFEESDNTFQGVLFRDLLSLWQVSPEATQLTMTALNDYEVQVPITLLQDYPVMLALQQNGQPMERDYRGPAMLVAPLTQYPTVKELANQQYWIWQIEKIHVE